MVAASESSSMVPAAQGVHDAVPEMEKVPGGQDLHCVVLTVAPVTGSIEDTVAA